MRILVLNYEYPPLGGGGAPVAENLAKRCVSAGHSVEVVTMRYRDQPLDETRDGVRLHRVRCLRKHIETCETPEMMSYVASALIPTLRLCRRMKPDVIHCHFAVPTGLLALMVHWATGVPYALTVHGSDLPGHNTTRFKLAHRFTPPIVRRVLSNASRIVSPSHFLAEHLRSTCGPYNVEVIPNGIDFRRFNADNPNRKTAVLMSGRLLESKRFVESIEALSKIPGDYEIHVAGDGQMRERMEAIAKEMPQKVVFHGWLDGSSNQLKELYETCSIFVLPSDRENAPVSLLEAMAAGMAIVTSDGSGCRETADDCGVLAPPRDVEALRNAFSELLSNPVRVKEFGRAARNRVETCFDEDMLSRRYIALLTEVAKHHNSEA